MIECSDGYSLPHPSCTGQNADKGTIGHIRYVAEKLVLQQQCSLCDITHKGLFERNDWKSCVEDAPLQVKVMYRNELPKKIEQATQGEFPCGILERKGELTKAFDSTSINQCTGSVSCLSHMIVQLP